MKENVIAHYIEKFKSLVGENTDFQGDLSKILTARMQELETDMPLGIVETPVTLDQQLRTALAVTELLDQPDELLAQSEYIVSQGLAAIDWLLRPSCLVQDDTFAIPSSEQWNTLNPPIMKDTIRAVCRIDLQPQGAIPVHVGSGFICGELPSGEKIVMTNSHVVEQILRLGWNQDSSLHIVCNFAKEHDRDRNQTAIALHKYFMHPSYDLALLYIHPSTFNFEQPESLPILSAIPENLTGKRIGVIGHPWFDASSDPFPKLFGFGNVYSVKRFSPGIIQKYEFVKWGMGHERELFHDATTLRGSSGSCVVDLDNQMVIGLHFGGWPNNYLSQVIVENSEYYAGLYSANGAVPLWDLYNDPALAHLNWQEN